MEPAILRPLELDWFGMPVEGSPGWSLSLKDRDLVLRGRVNLPPVKVSGDHPGAFREGLWLGDLVEVFLLDPTSGYYLELNLSPMGGWWACGHVAPRVRVPEGAQRLDGGRTRMVAADDRWDSVLRVPVESLPEALAFDPAHTRGNVTFCLGTPQRYLSVADLGGGEPDFHRPAAWLPLGALLD